jgi:hypothetical protein
MSDPRVADEVTADLAAVRGNLHQVWGLVEELRGYARGAERTIDDVEAETSRVRLSPPQDPRAAAYLRNAGDQLDILRQRCAVGSSLAGDIEERLTSARRHLDSARHRLAGYEDVRPMPGGADVSSLTAKVEDLAVLVDLAAPLAKAARTHLKEAAETAAALTSPSLSETERQYVALRIDRGTQVAGRSVVRGEEAARHLDRTLEYAGAGAARSLGHADAVAAAAHAHTGGDGQPAKGPLFGNHAGPAR